MSIYAYACTYCNGNRRGTSDPDGGKGEGETHAHVCTYAVHAVLLFFSTVLSAGEEYDATG